MPQRNHPVLPLAKPPCRKAYLGRKLCGKRKHINFQALSVIVECFFAAGLLPVAARRTPRQLPRRAALASSKVALTAKIRRSSDARRGALARPSEYGEDHGGFPVTEEESCTPT